MAISQIVVRSGVGPWGTIPRLITRGLYSGTGVVSLAKTYLQLVNLVLVNLRETVLTTLVTPGTQTALVMSFVNAGKRQVENHWKWDQLRKTIKFNSIGGTDSYDTSQTGVVLASIVTNERSYLPLDVYARALVFDITPANGLFRMRTWTRNDAVAVRTTYAQAIAIPGDIAIYQNGSGLTALFPYPPTGVRNYSFDAICPQDDLALDTDVMLAPWEPVVLYATALAYEERGEEFGPSAQRYWDLYEDSLATSVSRVMTAADSTMVPI